MLIGLPLPGFALLGGVALLAFAMVSSFPYAKLARLVKLPPWLWLLPVVGALVDARLTFALVVVASTWSAARCMWARSQARLTCSRTKRAAPGSGAAAFARRARRPVSAPAGDDRGAADDLVADG